MIQIEATRASAVGVSPSEELIASMAEYHEELARAGVLVDASGLLAGSKGWKIQCSGDRRTVADRPVPETKELIDGYTLIQVDSREEALKWSRRCPNPVREGAEAEIKVRRLFEFDDFGTSEATGRFRAIEVSKGGDSEEAETAPFGRRLDAPTSSNRPSSMFPLVTRGWSIRHPDRSSP